MRFCDIDLTLYARTGLSRKRRSEGGTSLPDMMEPTMWVKKYIATLATDENARMGKGSAAAGRNSVVATLPTGEGRDK